MLNPVASAFKVEVGESCRRKEVIGEVYTCSIAQVSATVV